MEPDGVRQELRREPQLGRGVEECRRELAEVVEEWVLVRVARVLMSPGWVVRSSAGPTRAASTSSCRGTGWC